MVFAFIHFFNTFDSKTLNPRLMKKNYPFYLVALIILISCFSAGNLYAQVPVVTGITGPTVVCTPFAPGFTATATNAPTSYSWSVMPSSGVSIGNATGSVASFTFT